MVEIIKKGVKQRRPKLQKELVTVIGKKLYEFEDVKHVAVYVEFNDGSGMRFRKGKDDD